MIELNPNLSIVEEVFESEKVLTFHGLIPYWSKGTNQVPEDGNWVAFILTLNKDNVKSNPDYKIKFGQLDIPKSWIKRGKLRLQLKVKEPGQSERLTVLWNDSFTEVFTIQVTPDSILEDPNALVDNNLTVVESTKDC